MKFTLKVEWAKDNGRGGEFIKKRKYSKAKYCFECGVRLLFVSKFQETGHTSYTCPKNVLGNRARPKKKKRTSGEDSEFLKAWLASDGDDI